MTENLSDCCVMRWDQRRYKQKIPWDPNTNTATIRSAPGTHAYQVFQAIVDDAQEAEANERVAYQTHLIPPDDDDDEQQATNDSQTPPLLFKPANDSARHADESPELEREENMKDLTSAEIQKDMPTPTHVIPDEEILAGKTDQAELLRWHYRLGHQSFKLIKLLAALRILPGKLANVESPKCAGCLYGAMTKRPWRTKSKQDKKKIFKTKEAGECVSVDQLESPTPGFIPQLKGSVTKRRYQAATIFVDHFSGLSYVHLQRQLTSKETVEAKHAFEAFARRHHVRIKHYHADNGRFADNAYMQDVKQQGQTISFCGVNAHFQNGIAEKRIRDLQEQARKQLLHAKARWPSAIEVNLWPSALRNSNEIRNNLPNKDDGTSPIERFANVEVAPNLKAHHTFGCPVFALDNALQGRGSIPKWNRRARLGINLGPSTRHAGTVSLVLSLETGLTSPQFHLQYDDFFETVRPSAGNPTTFSQWQHLSGLGKKQKQTKVVDIFRQSRQREVQTQRPEPEPNIPPSEALPDNAPHDEVLTGNEPELEQQHAPMGTTSVSSRGRLRRPTQRMMESQEQRHEGIVAYEAHSEAYYDAMHEDEYRLQYEMDSPIAFMTKSDGDSMYFD